MNAPTRTSIRMVLPIVLALGWGGLAGSSAQAQTRAMAAHSALNNAIDCYRRGDYEAAAQYFQQAQAAQHDLSANEQQDLARHLQLNTEALAARQHGHEQLALAEEAYRNGRVAEADTLLKDVTVNQFLSPVDRQRRQQLSDGLRQNGSRYDDVAQGGKMDAKGFLASGRTALAAGDLDRADYCAGQAEKLTSRWSMHFWGDSPRKLKEDVQLARARKTAVTTAVVRKDPVPDQNTDAARKLIQQGRQALQRNDVATARNLADQAVALNPVLRWDEDNPVKLLNDIHKVEQIPIKTASVQKGPEAKPEPPPVDPRAVLKQGRDLLAAGKIDEARERALRAQSQPEARWGYFEDNPDKLLKDVMKARIKKDQEEAERELREARKLFEQGDMEGARSRAYRAQRLHGPYSLWSFGDRPNKLLEEIEAAQTKKQQIVLPPAPPAPPGPPGPAAPKDQVVKPQVPAISSAVQPVSGRP